MIFMSDMKVLVKKSKDWLLDLVYPPNIYCIGCGRPIDKRFPYSLCPACAKSISWANGNLCAICGKSIEEDRKICPDCEQVTRDFDRGITVSDYSMTERKIIHDFKYRDSSFLKKDMALLMWEKLLAEDISFDCIVAVPMHKSKVKKRGYNQAELLAGEIADLSGKIHYPGALIRTRDTPALSSMDYFGRKAAVEGVFQPAEWVKNMLENREVLLVDDILTTGSTASACSRALKEAKAGRVIVISFASGTTKCRISEEGIARVCG